MIFSEFQRKDNDSAVDRTVWHPLHWSSSNIGWLITTHWLTVLKALSMLLFKVLLLTCIPPRTWAKLLSYLSWYSKHIPPLTVSRSSSISWRKIFHFRLSKIFQSSSLVLREASCLVWWPANRSHHSSRLDSPSDKWQRRVQTNANTRNTSIITNHQQIASITHPVKQVFLQTSININFRQTRTQITFRSILL